MFAGEMCIDGGVTKVDNSEGLAASLVPPYIGIQKSHISTTSRRGSCSGASIVFCGDIDKAPGRSSNRHPR